MKKQAKKDFLGTGRRKRAVARVYIRQGTGKISVNGKDVNVYFPTERLQKIISSPLEICQIEKKDIIVMVNGGGIEGQCVAARLGISRALVKEDEEKKAVLKEQGFLTRDPRKKERKKYGLRGARRSFQFSKR